MKRPKLLRKIKKNFRERSKRRAELLSLKLAKIKDRNKKRIEGLEDTYITNNIYTGKKRSHIAFVPRLSLLGMFIIAPLGLLSPDIDGLLFFILLEAYAIYSIFFLRVCISKEGIRYKKKFFKWDQIKTIGIGVNGKGMPREFCHKLLYISKHEHEKPLQLIHGSPTKNVQTLSCNQGANIPYYLILTSFNVRLIHHIIAYWGMDIKNLNDTAGWYSYLRLYNFLHRKRKKEAPKAETNIFESK